MLLRRFAVLEACRALVVRSKIRLCETRFLTICRSAVVLWTHESAGRWAAKADLQAGRPKSDRLPGHLALVSGLLLTGWVHAQPVSLTELARQDQYHEVKISPDGRYLAASGLVRGHQMLALIRLADMHGHVVESREGDDVVGFWWASPTRVVYTVGEHVGGYDAPLATGELFAVNADGSGAQLLYGYRKGGMSTGSHIQQAVSSYGQAQFIAAIPDDPQYALVAVSDWAAAGHELGLAVAYRMNLTDGRLARIVTAPGRGMAFVADHAGHIRFAYGEANDGSAQIFQHPVGGDGWQAMPKAQKTRAWPQAFSRDDTLAYFTCSPAGGGMGVCTWNPATGAWTMVWSHPTVEASALLHGLARNSITGVAFEEGRPSVALFDIHSAYAKALVLLMQQFPGEYVRFVSGSRDGSLSVMLASSDVDPGTFYLYHRDSGKLTLLLKRAGWIDHEQMAQKQPIEFAARDGLKLHGYLSFPPGQPQGRHLPMVVFVHGGPFGIRDDWDFDPYVQMLATAGYLVLQVNYRGSGGYGYAFERAGWRQWGGTMQDDVTDATRWAIAQGDADSTRVCIFGGSYGGYAALEGAVKEPDLYRCAIGYVGVYDLPLMYRRGDIPQSSYGEDYLTRELGTNMQVLAAHSPINQLDRLKARVMLVVGGEDYRVPSIQGRSLHMALLKRGIAHTWIDQPDEMHGFYDEAHRAALFQSVLQFLGDSIGPGAAGAKASAKR